MSEIKGQLLGIILTLMVFGAVSVVIASVYSKTAAKVRDYGTNIEVLAADEVGYDIPTEENEDNGNAHGSSFAFPGLSF